MSKTDKENYASLAELGVIDFGALFANSRKVEIEGRVISDAKVRTYKQTYIGEACESSNLLKIARSDGKGETWITPKCVSLTKELVAFFGLYSGDGTKGTEVPPGSGVLKLDSVSFEQREVNIVRFAMEQFRALFGTNISFNFSLGEDSAIFFEGKYHDQLKLYYGGTLPRLLPLSEIKLTKKDEEYLSEHRDYQTNGTEHDLQFYYSYKEGMRAILSKEKNDELRNANIPLMHNDTVTASLRRPFKKGARNYGKSSRSDGMSIKGTNGLAQLFLKIMHTIEDTILNDCESSSCGLIKWSGSPNEYGLEVSTEHFFTEDLYGEICGERPSLNTENDWIIGKWGRGKPVNLCKTFTYTARLGYVSGLYLAEGTDHDKMISMYKVKPKSLSFSFTSSEDQSLSIVLSQLEELFVGEQIVNTWKVKVGSQYFAELTAMSNKLNVPMLRGGVKGQGKLKTVELSLAIKDWALGVCPTMETYSTKFTHVEPTGAGVARIDFSSSSSICKWVFPIFMSTVFSSFVSRPGDLS